ncbi:GNAT family N-acetyltransferase [Clostridium sp. AF19-22AC]|jgi:predicted acetyltransferase|uniref:GNAT family N-acetyltransferase n=1 Tax=Clostridia TaxID=186801 RepID=UPI000E498CCE|nr:MULTISPECIES: GNAT family N-acetyltransferase [Clostridia]RHR29511.1 GNAT family N-acetyltransferase [Clostridium sp. AF19-22AC]
MQLRKLEINEHGRTRTLWEKVFAEDSREFLDYYYFIKTRDNQIYVIEEDGGVRSMLQLNPYLLQVEDRQFPCNYIIAVATEENYRKRGYMGELLRKAMQDMYARKEPFTFLMPAAEAIYTPYDFRFVYAQNQCESMGTDSAAELELTDAGMRDAADMAAFFNQYFAEKYQVCAVRDETYYQTMIFEQQSENGGVKLIKEGQDIKGMFAYASEENVVEIREPLYLDEYEAQFQKAVRDLRSGRDVPVKIYACRNGEHVKKVPIIMVRILHLETFLSAVKVKEGERLSCSFAVLDSIITKNSRVWKLTGGQDSRDVQVSETEDSEGVLTISALTSFLFGYKTVDEIRGEEGVIIPGQLGNELNKIQALKQTFLNEIV